ncbi:beta-galactosidase GalB [Teredinibacter turnerae]|uniref:beta-galactosidase GalB n=1 Tax=Teredinibacter turnerae TaxID=2426 RepID=UPI0030CCD0C5
MRTKAAVVGLALAISAGMLSACIWTKPSNESASSPRERILLDDGWRFMKYEDAADADGLVYDIRPDHSEHQDDKAADAKPTEAVTVHGGSNVLRPWILPMANPFIADPAQHYAAPASMPPHGDFPFIQADFDDRTWQTVSVPHDWAIQGPFYEGDKAPVGGGMGRLPSPGVGWYRKQIMLTEADAGKSLFLDIDGAMSYAMVWFNGHLVGGWPYGYASWRVDLTPYVVIGKPNQIAIRVDNPPASSRWYPGGGLYRNVWLVKTQPVHVAQWGTKIVVSAADEKEATVRLSVALNNQSPVAASVQVETDVYELNEQDEPVGAAVAKVEPVTTDVEGKGAATVNSRFRVINPKLWGPRPTQTPNRYVAITKVVAQGKVVDEYRTPFGIRTIEIDPNLGVLVNGEPIYLQGVNQHHDLGALGAAFNVRAAQRQLELLQEMGTNAIRLAHNPPARELLTLTDKMGFLVIDEVFDSWQRKKTPLDFHLIFDDWSEADLRSMIRRDRNHPSVFMWSVGNEVGEQYTDTDGAKVGQRLHDIAHSEDPTRPTAASMNYAKAHMPFPETMDTISLNYQGEGIRDAEAYAHLKGIRTPPSYPQFHKAFPGKAIFSSENAAAVSSRGEYLFPVARGISAPVADGKGGDPSSAQVSAYELYTAPFGSSADKVFRSLAQHPYVAGGFVWSGWDYLGEPTPYYSARSSYFGVIDLAGFKKDRFYLYQAHWRPDYPMAHILPHWNWPDRVGKVTPVHVFTSGDEAELFVNGKSQGRKQKGDLEYRLRWDDVVYQPGEVSVVVYKNGEEWATDTVVTTGEPAGLTLTVDRAGIQADGKDLAFVTATVVDANGRMVPTAKPSLTFTVSGAGELVATDNGDATDLVAFPSAKRSAFNGLALAIVRAKPGSTGTIKVTVAGENLSSAMIDLNSNK